MLHWRIPHNETGISNVPSFFDSSQPLGVNCCDRAASSVALYHMDWRFLAYIA
jgi:hypothetical protein